MNKKQRKEAKQAAERFMTGWMNRDWYKMRDACQKTWISLYEESAHERLEILFSARPVARFVIRESYPTGETSLDVTIRITDASGESYTVVCRTICETAPYTPSLEGTWGVNPVSALRIRE